VLLLENRIVRLTSFPFGSSLFCIAEKP
jgi:hypothetical protein